MSQIFHPASNTLAKASIFGGIFILMALIGILAEISRSPYITQVSVAREQPIPFSHKHHVEGLGLDCRYCHTSVETSSAAGIPSISTCMNCHSVIWNNAKILEPLRESFRKDLPVEWVRVHDLPDFVYFDHSIHVQKGIGCAECHGEVHEMPLMWRVETLHMEWCLSCHRNPEKYVRPKEEVFNTAWVAPSDDASLRQALANEYQLKQKTNCTVCHR